MHYDQVDFIPEMKLWFIMQKSVKLIHHINKLKVKELHKYLIGYLLGILKVFYKIRHPFMINVLGRSWV